MEFDSTTPIWLQMVSEFTRRIARGEWPPGGRVASVRELAAELGVNPNTVQRAFAELDRLALTVTERTAGRFVTTDAALIQRVRFDQAQDAADAYVALASGLQLTLDEATALLTQRWNGRDHDRPHE